MTCAGHLVRCTIHVNSLLSIPFRVPTMSVTLAVKVRNPTARAHGRGVESRDVGLKTQPPELLVVRHTGPECACGLRSSPGWEEGQGGGSLSPQWVWGVQGAGRLKRLIVKKTLPLWYVWLLLYRNMFLGFLIESQYHPYLPASRKPSPQSRYMRKVQWWGCLFEEVVHTTWRGAEFFSTFNFKGLNTRENCVLEATKWTIAFGRERTSLRLCGKERAREINTPSSFPFQFLSRTALARKKKDSVQVGWALTQSLWTHLRTEEDREGWGVNPKVTDSLGM